jgi:streptogramin lyase
LALEALEDRCLPAVTITEFKIPVLPLGTTPTPSVIAPSPDGNRWFVEGDALGKVTPNGVVTEFGPSPTERSTTGPDGNVWYTSYQAFFIHSPDFFEFSHAAVTKITSSGAFTVFALPNDASDPGAITTGPDGNLWFTEFYSRKIGRITPAGSVTEFPVVGNPREITTGPDGDLWFINDSIFSYPAIARMDANGTLLGQLKISGFGGSITAGPDGHLWVTERGPNQFARITPTGVVTEFHPFPAGTDYIGGIAVGADGNLWFEEGRASKIGSLGLDGALLAELPTTSSTLSIKAGPVGTLRFAEINGTIGMAHHLTSYVETLYESVLGRSAAAAELNYWLSVQAQGGHAAVANGIQRSDEAHARLVGGWYKTYLGRQADSLGLQYFMTLLRTGTEEQALAQLLASREYYNHAPSVPGVGGGAATDQTYVQALFQQLLGHGAGPDALAYWQGQVAAVGRAFAAFQLMGRESIGRPSSWKRTARCCTGRCRRARRRLTIGCRSISIPSSRVCRGAWRGAALFSRLRCPSTAKASWWRSNKARNLLSTADTRGGIVSLWRAGRVNAWKFRAHTRRARLLNGIDLGRLRLDEGCPRVAETNRPKALP